jgi:hypothetical protein
MASIGEIRAAIKETLETAIPGLHVHALMAGVANVPAVVVQPVEADYDGAMGRGLDTWNFDLIVLASRADERTSQERLDELVDGGGDRSVRKAIFDNRKLGLADGTQGHISGMSDYNGRHDVGTMTYAGATLRLVVTTKPA